MLLTLVAGGEREVAAGQRHQRAVQPHLVAEEAVQRRGEEDLVRDQVAHRLRRAAEAVGVERRRRIRARERRVQCRVVGAEVGRRVVVIAAVADQRLELPAAREVDAHARRRLPVLRATGVHVQRQVVAEVVVERVRRAGEARRPDEERIGLRHGQRGAGVGGPPHEVALAVETVEHDGDAFVDLVGRGRAERVVFLLGEKVLPGELVAEIGRARHQLRRGRLRHARGRNGVGRGGRADRAGRAARDAVVAAAGGALVVAEEIAIIARQRIAMRVLVREHQLAALTHHAPGGADHPLAVFTAVGEAVTTEGLDAVERSPRDDVDDTRDGIRSVDRRRAIGDDLDPLDPERRDDRRVGRAAVVDDAVTVEHHQRRIGADAAQVDGVAVDDVAGAARLAARVLADAQIEVLRQLLDRAIERHLPRCRDIRRAERRDGRADRCRAAHAAAGDDDLADVVGRFSGGCDARRERRECARPQHRTHGMPYSLRHKPPVIHVDEIVNKDCAQPASAVKARISLGASRRAAKALPPRTCRPAP